ncbi:MAG: grxD [Microvirga sp.]|nr:grxD [Microvirga sp.]
MADANQIIDNEVKSNDVVLFMKGTPQFPMCGFSGQVVQILNYLGVPYKGVNVLEDETVRQGIKDYSNWPTIPQLYVKGEFVGGCDITREMFQAGELQQLFADKGPRLFCLGHSRGEFSLTDLKYAPGTLLPLVGRSWRWGCERHVGPVQRWHPHP